MKTIALRFSDNYAPPGGTIINHEKIINKKGYVWYGKFGNKINQNYIDEMINSNITKVLFVKSGTNEQYWAYFTEYSNEVTDYTCIPEYYRDNVSNIKSWFKITRFEKIDKDLLDKCIVISSNDSLKNAISKGMCSCFKITYEED